ncbi:hypothetical protein RJD24_15975 [Bacillaceae bacterium IKA-2]|nr:hypothetical protein RJD24_15975 [Bacillaceae bacterium IKA-2]
MFDKQNSRISSLALFIVFKHALFVTMIFLSAGITDVLFPISAYLYLIAFESLV